MDAQPPLPAVIYAAYSAEINENMLQRAINAATNIMQRGGKEVHLMFQSAGGFIGDGIALHNFFKALTLDVTIYNTGTVSSMGVIAFLGIPKRRVNKHATFMIHRSHRSLERATAAKLEEAAASLRIDDARVEAILREHITLSEEQWEELNYNDLTFTAEEAIKAGFAQEIADFAPPPATSIFTF
jgi:ATP-dependent Clp protease protease subunit